MTNTVNRNKDARKNRRFLSDRRGKRSFQVSYGKITGNNFQEKISRLTEFDGEWKIYIYIYRNIGKGKTDRCCGGGYLIIEFLEARLGWKELDFANATDVSSDGRIQFGRARRGIWYSWF